MIFNLIEPVIGFFATTRSRSSSFLWLALIFLSGCQSEHQKLSQGSNQISPPANSHAIVKKAVRKKSHLNTSVGAHHRKKKNNLDEYKLDTIEKNQLKAPASQEIKSFITIFKDWVD